jgi:hypothetical protein
MIWIPIIIAALALLRCIALEKRTRRYEVKIARLHYRIESLLRP